MIKQFANVVAPGHSRVAYWEGFLSDEEINTLLAYPQWAKSGDAKVGGGLDGGVVNEQIRRTGVSWLDLNENTNWVYEKIASAIASVNAQYFGFDLPGMSEQIQLGTYKDTDEGHYGWHIDEMVAPFNRVRKLSMALLLDDPSTFEGGELQIMNANANPISLEQKRGRAWFFPSWMLHQVTPVTKGIRRSAVVWVGGPEFK